MKEFERARFLESVGGDLEKLRLMMKELSNLSTDFVEAAISGLQQKAKILRAYYVALKKEGFSSLQAFLIVFNTKI